MNDPIFNAEIAQMQARMGRLMVEKDAYVRVTIILAKALLSNTPMGVVDGNLVVKRGLFEGVHKAFSVTLRESQVESESAEPNADPIDVLVIEVKSKDQNGSVLVKPVLQFPGR